MVLLLYARDEIRRRVMDLGMVFAFIYSLFNAYTPIKRLGSLYHQFQLAAGASVQVVGFLALEEEVAEKAGSGDFAAIFERSVDSRTWDLRTRAGR